MKKAFALILALVMVLALCACGSNAPAGTEPTNGTEAPKGTTAPKDTTPTQTTEESTGDAAEPTGDRPSRLPTENLYEELPASCEHGYADATCTKPKTCVICGFELGDPLGHDFVNGTCSRCGEAE